MRYILDLGACVSMIIAPWWCTAIVLCILVIRYRAWETILVAFLYDALYTPYMVPIVTLGVLALVWGVEPLHDRLW